MREGRSPDRLRMGPGSVPAVPVTGGAGAGRHAALDVAFGAFGSRAPRRPSRT